MGTGVRVRPLAGRAACWCNVKADGTPDPRLVHEAEALACGGLISMEAALHAARAEAAAGAAAGPSLLKIGLNLWFTDRHDYPRPELAPGGAYLGYAAADVQQGR
mmetsp:Transcript_32900/g.74276  ORF Transcript_32900/g.74276 Transcript_32900/m.74276 type:complete len:105 (+) Transcript_32900:135-449(+)